MTTAAAGLNPRAPLPGEDSLSRLTFLRNQLAALGGAPTIFPGLASPGLLPFFDDSALHQRPTALNTQVDQLTSDLRRQLDELRIESTKATEDKARTEGLLAEYIATDEKRKRTSHLLGKVHPRVEEALTPERVAEFLTGDSQPMFVMSVDIRGSTDLMLRAPPEDFAKFITGLCNRLSAVVQDHYGLVDKFTGDGILCFFPESLSGAHAGSNIVSAAAQCHSVFEAQYEAECNVFEAVRLDTGLGIGIDHGNCSFVFVNGVLTAVGKPVVYACRFGAGKAGTTLLNQPAYNVIRARHAAAVHLSATDVEIKPVGRWKAYGATLVEPAYVPVAPEWLTAEAVPERLNAAP